MSSSTTSTFNDACAVLPFSMTLHPVPLACPPGAVSKPDASFKAYTLASAMDRVRRKRWSKLAKRRIHLPRRCRTACNQHRACRYGYSCFWPGWTLPVTAATGAGKPGTGPGRTCCATAPRSRDEAREARAAWQAQALLLRNRGRASRRKSTSSPASARNTKPGSSDAKPFCARLRRASSTSMPGCGRMPLRPARRHGQRNRQRR